MHGEKAVFLVWWNFYFATDQECLIDEYKNIIQNNKNKSVTTVSYWIVLTVRNSWEHDLCTAKKNQLKTGLFLR